MGTEFNAVGWPGAVPSGQEVRTKVVVTPGTVGTTDGRVLDVPNPGNAHTWQQFAGGPSVASVGTAPDTASDPVLADFHRQLSGWKSAGPDDAGAMRSMNTWLDNNIDRGLDPAKDRAAFRDRAAAITNGLSDAGLLGKVDDAQRGNLSWGLAKATEENGQTAIGHTADSERAQQRLFAAPPEKPEVRLTPQEENQDWRARQLDRIRPLSSLIMQKLGPQGTAMPVLNDLARQERIIQNYQPTSAPIPRDVKTAADRIDAIGRKHDPMWDAIIN
jgi:hypothetical protein